MVRSLASRLRTVADECEDGRDPWSRSRHLVTLAYVTLSLSLGSNAVTNQSPLLNLFHTLDTASSCLHCRASLCTRLLFMGPQCTHNLQACTRRPWRLARRTVLYAVRLADRSGSFVQRNIACCTYNVRFSKWSAVLLKCIALVAAVGWSRSTIVASSSSSFTHSDGLLEY